MKINIPSIVVLLVTFSFLSCDSNKKTAEAVVMTNEEIQDSLQTSRLSQPDLPDSSVLINEYKTENEASTRTGTNDPSENASGSSLNGTSGTSEEYTATYNSSASSNVSSPAITPVKPQPRTVVKKATVQQLLAKDARLAKKMSLNRFGSYMTRRWNLYKSYGEVSYQDKTVEIKITDEELKIETPEGKYKREADEMKLKTDAGKVKKETR